jgi:multiple sugar transport system substrate-binding protein
VIEPVQTRGIDMDQYLPGLAKLWKSPDGKQYGFPKDWDTVAVVVNENMLAKAGVTMQQLAHATWNPTNGGTFQQIAAKLSIDAHGRRGDQPGFDPHNVKVYGLGFDPGGLTYGQTTWAGFAASLGFRLLNKNPWGTHYNYDDPRFAATMNWWRTMIRKGFMPSLEEARTLGQAAAFQSGKAALAIDGDWTISTYSATKGIKVGYAPQPAGPKGSWSMFNGLADGIWVGTKHRPQAVQWVRFLASPACQSIVGTKAVVFPAIKAEIPKAVATHDKQHIDVSAFLSYVKAKHTVLYPITEKAAQINLIVQPTLENFLNGNEPALKVMRDMNTQVNNQLKYSR